MTVGAAGARAQAPIADPGAFRPLTVGSDLTFPPFAFRQPDGKIAGFSVDFTWEIAKRLGRPGVDVIETPVASLFPGLNAKRYEFIAAPIVVTAERAQQLLFTEPYMSTGLGVLLPADDADLKAPEELKGKTVAILKGGAADAWATENASRLGFEVQRLDRVADIPPAVMERKAQAGILDLPIALQAAKQHRQIKNGFTILTGRVIAFAFRQDDAAFRNRVELIVEEMKKDGSLAGLYQAWFGARPPVGSVTLTADEANFGTVGFPGHGAK
ncbi:MAG: amino acid ABC transporter substrate-binding protein [Alphaproteobacteria bacterium]|nr:amino acid ABC transporter substrate-binding protein [Alphaproteobacteria bacterium]